MINFWYQLDWKIQYAATIILMIVVLQLGAITFYTNTDRKKYIQSEENDRKSGKGRIIHELMQSIGIPTFIDGYHIGWIWEEAEEE